MNLTKHTNIPLALALSASAFLTQNIFSAGMAQEDVKKTTEKVGEKSFKKASEASPKNTENATYKTARESANGTPAKAVVKIKAKAYKPKKLLAATEEGKLLYSKNNCAACHTAEGKGGCLAPPLDGIGSYHPKTYLIARITLGDKFEKRFEANHENGELMEHPRIPFAESKLIADYLYSLPSLPAGYQMTSHGVEIPSNQPSQKVDKKGQEALKLDPKLVSRGRHAFAQAGCFACHTVDGAGGRFAPKLNGIASRHSLDYVRKMINRAELKPIPGEVQDEYAERGNVMPPAGLSDEDIESISQFLMSLK